jgi:hypothetical protein
MAQQGPTLLLAAAACAQGGALPPLGMAAAAAALPRLVGGAASSDGSMSPAGSNPSSRGRSSRSIRPHESRLVEGALHLFGPWAAWPAAGCRPHQGRPTSLLGHCLHARRSSRFDTGTNLLTAGPSSISRMSSISSRASRSFSCAADRGIGPSVGSGHTASNTGGAAATAAAAAATAAGAAGAPVPAHDLSDALKVADLIHRFRARGHLAAQLDPLGRCAGGPWVGPIGQENDR